VNCAGDRPFFLATKVISPLLPHRKEVCRAENRRRPKAETALLKSFDPDLR